MPSQPPYLGSLNIEVPLDEYLTKVQTTRGHKLGPPAGKQEVATVHHALHNASHKIASNVLPVYYPGTTHNIALIFGSISCCESVTDS